MKGQEARIVSQTVSYIEGHLNSRLELDAVAEALHYSKFHLHRLFRKTAGMTIHDYVVRRRLTEAARLLVFSKKPLAEIALISGYESQQAFTGAFKVMYKTPPARFRETAKFYPLQLEFHLRERPVKMKFTKEDIRFALPADVDNWMELVDLTVDGYPCLDRSEYAANLRRYIAEKRALLLRDGSTAVSAMGFSADGGSIDFLAVHPQYRRFDVTELFLQKLTGELLQGREISVTTYRAGDKADTGYRGEYRRLGFVEKELLVEYGYPTQRFALLPRGGEGNGHA